MLKIVRAGQLAARADGVAHGRVEGGREEEGDAHLLDALGRLLGVSLQVDAQRFQHVGAAARLFTERLPCLATLTPCPATTKAAVVLMLKVSMLSPPVPTMSISMASPMAGRTCTALRFMARAQPVISSTVSPFMRSAARKAPIWAAWPRRP